MAENGGGAKVEKGGGGMRQQLLHKVRRQAAKAVRTVLRGDEQRKASGSIRSLVYAPSVVAKKATLALTCHTLKYLPVLKEILCSTDLLSGKKKIPEELVYVLVCDLLFGQEVVGSGDAEKVVLSRKSALRSALARLLVKKNVASADELLPLEVSNPVPAMPRYVRVNTLKISFVEALRSLQEVSHEVEQDNLIPDLLVLPAGTDLHKHPLVLQGSLLLQGKASCMPAQALAPVPDWEVLDACAAPGNKTVQLAALMKGQGRVIACEVNENRVKRLRETVCLAGASNVEVWHQDFLRIDPTLPEFAKVKGILLDPSCSGSGTSVQRLDHLLPSAAEGRSEDELEKQRVEQLARFQQTALLHALSFPAVERVVYSTCSIHQRENEDVVRFVLPQANAQGFQLASPFPSWPHQGLPVFDGAHHLLRTDPSRDNMDGFFVALFVQNAMGVDELCTGGVIHTSDKNHTESPIVEIFPSVPKAQSSILRRRKLKRKRKKEQLVLQSSAYGATTPTTCS